MPSDDQLIDTICQAVTSSGYAIINQAFGAAFTGPLLDELSAQQPQQFKPAGIGRDAGFHTNQQIRGDHILWLQDNWASCAAYFQFMDALRMGLNRSCFLGLHDYECMFAHYPAGAAYAKHLDTFRAGPRRALKRSISTILYLNEAWQHEDGGELLLYQPEAGEVMARVVPQMGTLVVFLSEQFPHEVLPAKQSRYSLTGWFRTHG